MEIGNEFKNRFFKGSIEDIDVLVRLLTFGTLILIQIVHLGIATKNVVKLFSTVLM